MLIKKWRSESGETYFWMKANFKNRLVYTDVIQVTLKNPWFLPRYEDNFAGITGFRLYGWLFFYFGRYYTGIMYPAEDGDDCEQFLTDGNGKKWLWIGNDKIENFPESVHAHRRRLRRNMDIVYTRKPEENGKYSIIATFVEKKRA